MVDYGSEYKFGPGDLDEEVLEDNQQPRVCFLDYFMTYNRARLCGRDTQN